MKLRDIVVASAVFPALTSTKRDGVIGELVDGLVRAGVVTAGDRTVIVKESMARERKGSTGFGHGVAVPHAKSSLVTRPCAAIGLCPAGIDFSALDRQPVFTVVFLLSPISDPESHLAAMESIFGALSQESFRRFMRQAKVVEDITSLIDEVDGARAPR